MRRNYKREVTPGQMRRSLLATLLEHTQIRVIAHARNRRHKALLHMVELGEVREVRRTTSIVNMQDTVVSYRLTTEGSVAAKWLDDKHA